jgi:chromosome partitioning protein
MSPVSLRSDPFGIGPAIIVCAAWKGGVGKSLLAYELAYWLGGVLVDADWDAGGVTRQWGYRPEDRIRAPILDAIDTGRTPRPLTGVRKPRLIPSHPDLAVNQPAPDQFASCLEQWAAELGVPLVVDCHPGGVPLTYGALAAAKVIPTPVVLATKELAAAESMVGELPDYPLLIVPNKVPSSPPLAELTRLEKLSQGFPVAAPISHHGWLPTRKVRVAVTSYEDHESKRVARAAAELRAVAMEVTRHV